MVPGRGRDPSQRRTGTASHEEVGLASSTAVKPANEAVVDSVEQLAQLHYTNREGRHHFTFIYGPKNWDSYPFAAIPKSIKTWIVRSRRSHPEEWHSANAVVLSYRGKSTIMHFNVVVKGDDQAYRLGINLKTGRMRWRKLNTKMATELKEALEVAQR